MKVTKPSATLYEQLAMADQLELPAESLGAGRSQYQEKFGGAGL